ncbi:DUF6382 domain-containing protein [Paenibacillus ferrarius]|uniref:DUF6382 domain-containing protein n=1 Tax=Paenibacillus ferrarius TaxID=1469647 RepID=UPI003D27DE77
MLQSVYGLQVQFSGQYGHCMELYKEEGLKWSDLDTLQVKMLEASPAPFLLPCRIQEVDHCIRLYYELASKRMLASWIQVEELSLQQVSKLMASICTALLESANYMLDEAKFVLNEHFMFVGKEWSDVYLTYVPIAESEINGDTSAQGSDTAMDFFRRLAQYVDAQDRAAFEIWIEKHGTETSLKTLRDALSELNSKPDEATLRGEDGSVAAAPDQAGGGAQSSMEERSAIMNRDVSMGSVSDLYASTLPGPVRQSKHPRELLMPNVATGDAKWQLLFTPLSSRARWLWTGALLIVCAYVWSQFLDQRGTSQFQLAAGCTILSAVLALILHVRGFPRLAKETPAERQEPSPHGAATRYHDGSEASLSRAPMNVEDYYRDLPLHTTMLGQGGKMQATVFLGGMSRQTKGPRLDYVLDGKSLSVELSSFPFTIGRGEAKSEVGLVLDASGISRLHAEIVRNEEGQLAIKDTGSTNGTQMNGKPLVAYQPYPVQEGDVIRLVSVELTFRVSS